MSSPDEIVAVLAALAHDLASIGDATRAWEVVEPGAPINVIQGGFRLHPPSTTDDRRWVLRTVDRHGDYFVASFDRVNRASDFLRSRFDVQTTRKPCSDVSRIFVEASAGGFNVIIDSNGGPGIEATCYSADDAAQFANWLQIND